mmetsp:Transcript_177412/g.431546  ORF Transcript_177412/g.431546 Transcript_177412/m.431546 type:complete len:218 (-) Transcript_177412:271-924(-)
MPAADAPSGKKVLIIVGGVLALGLVIGFLCVVSMGRGSSGQVDKSVHQEQTHFLHGAEGNVTTSPPVIQTPAPEPEDHDEDEHEEKDDHEKEEHHNQHHEHNASEQHPGHEHKDCEGGPLAACECMMKCEVFGGNVSKCHTGNHHNHSHVRSKVDTLISNKMLSHRNMCEGMRCIRDCAQELGCLDEKVMTDCSIVKKNYADNKMDSDPDCELSCES